MHLTKYNYICILIRIAVNKYVELEIFDYNSLLSLIGCVINNIYGANDGKQII